MLSEPNQFRIDSGSRPPADRGGLVAFGEMCAKIVSVAISICGYWLNATFCPAGHRLIAFVDDFDGQWRRRFFCQTLLAALPTTVARLST